MRILITAGGTFEKIDDVRTIKNTSTGRLGQLIAEAFEDVEIDYVYGKGSLLPNCNVNLYMIEDVRSLEKTMDHLLSNHEYDAVIHAMAISDYEVYSVSTIKHLASLLSHKSEVEVYDILNELPEDLNRYNKIRSDKNDLVVFMRKAPKIIEMIKSYQNTYLIGFKLLVDVDENILLDEAKLLMERNDCDLVLANDATSIRGDHHVGYLVNGDLSYDVYHTKQDIAQAIKEKVMQL